MDDRPLTPEASLPPAAPPRRRALWPLVAVAIVAVVGAGAGAYFGLRGAAGPGSGPGTNPPPRGFAAAAYDEASHRVVLFGGIGADGSALNDTWTWDGAAWTQQHPATSPPARAFAAMTYDPKAHDVVLVGGRAVSSSPPTVCSGSITAGGPNATPGVARSAAACPVSSPAVFSDTWLWSGGTWRRAGSAPGQGQSVSLGTDPTTGQVLLLGESVPLGMNSACPSPAPSFPPGTPIPQFAIPCTMAPAPSVVAWVWSGSSWSAVPAASPPSLPGYAVGGFGALAADPTSGHLVVVRAGVQYACGGPAPATASIPCPLVEGPSGVSSSSGSGSAAIAPAQPPAATPPPAGIPLPMPTNVPAPGRVTCCSDSITTWTGSAWSTPRTFSGGPPVTTWGFAGDPAHHEMVAVTPQGTWTWNGSAWKAEHPSASPPPAEGSSLVYDGGSGKLLLFGGEQTAISKPPGPASQPRTAPVSDQLWAWDGSTWTQLTGATASPAPSPSASPAPTFVPPATPQPSASGAPRPSPSPSTAPCTPLPAPTPAPGKPAGTSTAPNIGCAVPSASPVLPG